MALNREYKTTDPELLEQGSGSGEKGECPPVGLHTVGHHVPNRLERYINLAAIVNFGVIILASWESFAVTFQFALTNGGPASIFYGSLLAGAGACAVGLSLAELASIDPTVGAQYRWSANFAPAAPRFWGLLQGWITTAAWCFACSGPPSILANMITSLVIFNYDNYVPERWHTSLIMIAVMWYDISSSVSFLGLLMWPPKMVISSFMAVSHIVIPLISNLWFRKVLDTFEMIGGILHIVLFVVFIVVLTVYGPRSDPEFVFKTLTSDLSGWNNPGVSWGLGLLSMTFSVTGADSVLHMCDEVKKVRTRVPRSMIIACTVNSAMLITFATILLFYMGPLDDIISTPLPLLWIIYNITGSRIAANVLISFLAIVFFLGLFNILASVSRLIWVFARDNGLPFSNFFAYVHPTLRLPVNALLLLGTIVTCLSLIYIASATAFNALISLQALALHVSYFFPILFILIRKLRGLSPPYGPFKMGLVGVPVNFFALCYLVYVVLWMPFPQVLPVTKDNMNYAGPIFAAVIVGALGHWFLRARRTFQMPVVRYE